MKNILVVEYLWQEYTCCERSISMRSVRRIIGASFVEYKKSHDMIYRGKYVDEIGYKRNLSVLEMAAKQEPLQKGRWFMFGKNNRLSLDVHRDRADI